MAQKYRMFNMLSPATDFWDSNNLADLIEQAKGIVKNHPISIIHLESCTEVATSNFQDFKKSGYNLRYIR